MSLHPAQLWTGRDDGAGPEHRRWHQVVRPAPASRELGRRDTAGATARTAIIGFASDEGVRRNQGRLGAADGPAALRAALGSMPVHAELDVVDVGDVHVEDRELERAQAEVGALVAQSIRDERRPIVLGGGHEVAYASYLGIAEALGAEWRGTIGIINLDAHFDLRDADRATSGTGFAQMAASEARLGRRFDYTVVGISELANTRVLFERAAELEADVVLDRDCRLDLLASVLERVQGALDRVDAVYLTIDLDVLPASVAPGVSAPAALGVDPNVIEAIVRAVAGSPKLLAADLAELNPRLDLDSRTARIGARFAAILATERTSQ